MKVESTVVEGRKVFTVRAFNQGISSWLERLPTLWVEGEVTELRRQQQWATVYFTLKDPENGACVAVQMKRGLFDGLRLELGNGERVHVYGRPELYEQRGELLAASTLDRAVRARRTPRGAREAEAASSPPRGSSRQSGSGRCLVSRS